MTSSNVTGSREYAIFHSFINNDKYADALKEMESFDKKCKGMRIFDFNTDKKSMRKAFMFFKMAETALKKDFPNADYDNPTVIEHLKMAFQSEVADFCTFDKIPSTNAVAIKKHIIGSMIDRCSHMIAKMEPRDWQRISLEKNLVRHQTAKVEKSGIVERGGFSRDSVISKKSGNGDKSIRQILMEREAASRKKFRA